MKRYQREALKHDLSAIRAVHAGDWETWRSFVAEHPSDRERAAGVALAEHLGVNPDAGAAAVREAMTAEHRRELRVVLEHVAGRNRWTVGTSPEIRRIGELLWQHRAEAAVTGLPDEVRQRHRAELTATMTDEYIDRLDGDGEPYRGFTDGRYRWHTTLNGGDDWLPRHPIPAGLPGAGTAVDLNRADAAHAVGIALNPPLSATPADTPSATPSAKPSAEPAHRPAQHTIRGITRS